ncbi:hypothetical protein BLOT_006769 [Blomia tropicalis]|nr:hypothetical protein BLOT_006769 [Blomia tropicalis]
MELEKEERKYYFLSNGELFKFVLLNNLKNGNGNIFKNGYHKTTLFIKMLSKAEVTNLKLLQVFMLHLNNSLFPFMFKPNKIKVVYISKQMTSNPNK